MAIDRIMQHRPPHPDDDWTLYAEEPPSQAHLNANTLAMDPRVFLRETPEDASMPSARLIDVLTSTAPWGPESTIEDAIGQVLAMADDDRAAWVCTNLGRDRVQREATHRRSA